jgi:hypothetical protein
MGASTAISSLSLSVQMTVDKTNTKEQLTREAPNEVINEVNRLSLQTAIGTAGMKLKRAPEAIHLACPCLIGDHFESLNSKIE